MSKSLTGNRTVALSMDILGMHVGNVALVFGYRNVLRFHLALNFPNGLTLQ